MTDTNASDNEGAKPVKHKRGEPCDFKRRGNLHGKAWGRSYVVPLEQCACGARRIRGGERAAIEARRDAKREALMLARASKQARKGKTAKQRAAARAELEPAP